MTLESERKEALDEKARQIRINSLKAITNAASGHPGGSLSCADILSVLYFDVMKHNPSNPGDPNRDYLIVSKGHASAAVYSALGLAGYFNLDEFVSSFRRLNSKFQGHIDRLKVPGVEISTGSLGQGLSMACGIALSLKLNKKENKVFVLMSDGELQEGQSWEAFMSCAHYELANLTVIIDRNKLQLDGQTEKTMALEPLKDKLLAFGWNVYEADGHSTKDLSLVLKQCARCENKTKPSVIIANTTKGKGVSFMENLVKWHGSPPSKDELEKALLEL